MARDGSLSREQQDTGHQVRVFDGIGPAWVAAAASDLPYVQVGQVKAEDGHRPVFEVASGAVRGESG